MNWKIDSAEESEVSSVEVDDTSDELYLRIDRWLSNRGITMELPCDKQEEFYAQKRSSVMNLQKHLNLNNSSLVFSLDNNPILKRRQTKKSNEIDQASVNTVSTETTTLWASRPF